jgi:hypothetical protein
MAAVFAAVHLAGAAWILFGSSAGNVAGELPLDDAYIHLVYADGLAHGEGFVYNPDTPAAGTSSPAWAVMLSLVRLTRMSGEPLAVATQLLGLVLAWVTSLFSALLAARAFKDPLAGWIAGLAVALDPGFAMAALSGMEVALTAAAIAASLWAAVERRWALCGAALAVAVLARHESVLIVPVIAALAYFGATSRSEKPWPAAVRVVAIPAVAFAIWCARNLTVSGRPLPNTFYMKHPNAGVLYHLADIPEVFGATLADMPAGAYGAGLVPVALAVLALVRRGDRTLAAAWVALPLVFLAGIVWALDVREWLPLCFRRYSMPVLPMLDALFGAGIAVAIRSLRGKAETARWERAVSFAAVGAAIATAVLIPVRLARDASHYGHSCRNIRETHGVVAEWLIAHTEPGEWVATNDAGAIRLWTDRNVLDLMGLNDHRVPDRMAEVVAEAHPRYYVVFESWFPHLTRSTALTEVFRAHTDDYVICERCDQDDLVVFEHRD